MSLNGQRVALAACVGLTTVLGTACGANQHAVGSLPVETVPLPTRTVTLGVPSSSMEPTLKCARPGVGCTGQFDDGAVTQEPARGLARGDVIVFTTPPLAAVRCGAGGRFVKRIIGMPGDQFAERSGFVYINGKKLNEPYVPADERDTRTMSPIQVPTGTYFLLGDNRASSCDSRAFGPIPTKDVIGKVVRVVRLG